ncbi:hypothetical protein ACFQAS_15685 [Halopenitus salinus]
MPERKRTEAGTFVETVTLEDVRDVFDEIRGPVVTSSDVSDRLGCTTEAARQKLTRLYDRGEVDKRKTGRTVIYWRAGEEDARADAVEPAAETPADATNAESGRTRDESDDLAEEVRQYLEETDTPPKTEHGRSAVLDVFRYLREHGTTKTGELQDEIYPEYTDEWGSARTMWNALDRYLGDVPGIAKGGYGEWTYTGDDAVREELGL